MIKFSLLLAGPPGVTTVIGPVVAPTGTVAKMRLAETSVTLAAKIPLKETL